MTRKVMGRQPGDVRRIAFGQAFFQQEARRVRIHEEAKQEETPRPSLCNTRESCISSKILGEAI
jgi:hypothetical protein